MKWLHRLHGLMIQTKWSTIKTLKKFLNALNIRIVKKSTLDSIGNLIRLKNNQIENLRTRINQTYIDWKKFNKMDY